jgi:uncharacterized protein (TIGR02246 family)
MTADEQEIRGLVAEWARATQAGEIASMSELMDEDVRFFAAGSEPFGRQGFWHHFEANVMSMRIEVRPEVQEVEISGDLAYALVWLQVRVLPRGGSEPMMRTGYALGVYRRRPGGRWKLWRDANLMLN